MYVASYDMFTWLKLGRKLIVFIYVYQLARHWRVAIHRRMIILANDQPSIILKNHDW